MLPRLGKVLVHLHAASNCLRAQVMIGVDLTSDGRYCFLLAEHWIASTGLCECEVLLMLWNSDLPWEQKEYQFLELFSGRAHASREWPCPHFGSFCFLCLRGDC